MRKRRDPALDLVAARWHRRHGLPVPSLVSLGPTPAWTRDRGPTLPPGVGQAAQRGGLPASRPGFRIARDTPAAFRRRTAPRCRDVPPLRPLSATTATSRRRVPPVPWPSASRRGRRGRPGGP